MINISAARQAASRANGALSHGPVSEAGKRRSSLNAARHGLAGRIVVLPKEDMERYQAFSQKLLEDLKPVGALEQQYAQTIVEQNWRLSRLLTIEDILLNTGGDADISAADPEMNAAFAAAQAFRDNANAFLILSTYEQRIQRTLEKALKQFKELQDERRFAEQRDLPHAIRRYKQNKKQGKPYDPQADGFVCSLAQVEREIDRWQLGDGAKDGNRRPLTL